MTKAKIYFGIGLSFLLLWISMMIWGNFLIPSFNEEIMKLSPLLLSLWAFTVFCKIRNNCFWVMGVALLFLGGSLFIWGNFLIPSWDISYVRAIVFSLSLIAFIKFVHGIMSKDFFWGGVGLLFLLLWISMIIWGNFLIPSFNEEIMKLSPLLLSLLAFTVFCKIKYDWFWVMGVALLFLGGSLFIWGNFLIPSWNLSNVRATVLSLSLMAFVIQCFMDRKGIWIIALVLFLLWISVMIWGNFIIPSWNPTIVKLGMLVLSLIALYIQSAFDEEVGGFWGAVGLLFLLLWISVLIFGNYLIPSWRPSMVRLTTFSIFALAGGYCWFIEEGYMPFIFINWTTGWLSIVALWALAYTDHAFAQLLLIGWAAISFLLWLIFVILTHVGRFGREVYKAVKHVIKTFVNGIINLFTIRNEISRKCPTALRAKIMKKKENAVDVGIFGTNNEKTVLTIESSDGVADEVHRGETITI